MEVDVSGRFLCDYSDSMQSFFSCTPLACLQAASEGRNAFPLLILISYACCITKCYLYWKSPRISVMKHIIMARIITVTF